jgi:predicted SAM-dependent methyltransferase
MLNIIANIGKWRETSKSNYSREEKVFHLIDKKGLGLEIGPSHNPLAPKKNGFNVHILDHATADQLKKKYVGHEIYGVNTENIEEVDFVWSGEPFEELIGNTGCYDWIIASHVIEHVPDLISFLQQCALLLKPEGILSLAIPDKRYCFDYFSPISFTGNVLDANIEKRVKPTPGQIFDHFANSSKRNGDITWSAKDKCKVLNFLHIFAAAKAEWFRSMTTTDYIDVHCWRFTPTSFRLLISDLRNLDLINLDIKAEFETTGCEFYVSLINSPLQKPVEIDRLNILQKLKLETC